MGFDTDDLKKAAREIAFDMYHFRLYAKLHRTRQVFTFGPTNNQAVLYSLLLHFRVLLDFFYKEAVQDDCAVGHFREFTEFAAGFPPDVHVAPEGAREVSMNLNKRLAHFTATRWREAPPDMAYYERYFAGIETLIERFQRALPAEIQSVFVGAMVRWERSHPEPM